jgi:hypothetical protein
MWSRIIAVAALVLAYLAYTREPPAAERGVPRYSLRIPELPAASQHAPAMVPPCGGIGFFPGRVRGDYDYNEVQRYVARVAPRLRYAYMGQLARDPDLGGEVTVRFEIAADGSVARTQAASFLDGRASASRNLVAAFERELLAVQFPPPDKAPVDVDVVFRLRALPTGHCAVRGF